MAVTLKPLWRDPVFRAGLLLRLLLIVALVPQIQHEWFIPFISHAITHPSLDPWTDFLDAGGVLHRQRRNHRQRVAAERGDGQQVGLNSSAAGRVAGGKGQDNGRRQFRRKWIHKGELAR